jgi:ribonuclease R
MRALIGSRTGETYRIGDSVEVKLVEAAPMAGALRFEIVGEGRRGAPTSRKSSWRGAAPSGKRKPARAASKSHRGNRKK